MRAHAPYVQSMTVVEEPVAEEKPPKVLALLLRTIARECGAMAEAYEQRNLRELAGMERMKAEDLNAAAEQLIAYGKLRRSLEKRFTIRDNGRWGWLVRDNEADKDLLTNNLDESGARALADELNESPPKAAPVYADPPFPDDTPSLDLAQPTDAETVYRVEVGANTIYFGSEVGDIEKVADFWRQTGATVLRFERSFIDERIGASEDP